MSSIEPRVVLVGPRAVGKSTVGRALATRLRLAFVDTDDVLADESGDPSAGALLVRVGEPEFRRLEERVVLRVCESTDGVVALGGGAVLSERVRSALRASASRVVYLTAGDQTLVRRLAADPAVRPALTPLPRDEEIAAVHAARRPLYRSVANLEVEVDDLDWSAVCDRVADSLDP